MRYHLNEFNCEQVTESLIGNLKIKVAGGSLTTWQSIV